MWTSKAGIELPRVLLVSQATAGKVYYLITTLLSLQVWTLLTSTDFAKSHKTAGSAWSLNLSTRWLMLAGSFPLVS